MTEEWRPAPGFEDFYEVSNFGRVRRSAPGRGTYAGRILNGSPDSSGYLQVFFTVNGQYSIRFIHRLVCEAFHGKPPEGKNFVLHYDDNERNNTADNLRWGDAFDNQEDVRRNGGHYRTRWEECVNGHPLSGDNLYMTKAGKRFCRECNKHRMRERRLRVKRES